MDLSGEIDTAEGKKRQSPDATTLFHVEEYKSLRAEIAQRVRDHRIAEYAAVIGPSLLYAWLFANHGIGSDKPFLLVVWFFPIVWCMYLWYRVRSNSRFILIIAAYITQIESTYRHSAIDGWEHYLAEQRRAAKSDVNALGKVEDRFWILVTSACFIVAVGRVILAGLVR